MQPIIFEVDGRAISWNQAHSGVHWAVRMKVDDKMKWDVKAGLLKFRINKTPLEVPIKISFEVYVGRPIDCDNVCLKFYIDGLRDWGLLKNDDPQFVSEIAVKVITKSKKEFVKITITD